MNCEICNKELEGDSLSNHVCNECYEEGFAESLMNAETDRWMRYREALKEHNHKLGVREHLHPREMCISIDPTYEGMMDWLMNGKI